MALRLVLFAGLCCHTFAQTWNCTRVLDWNFFGSVVTQNNLGGQGPNLMDKHEIRYSGVLHHDTGKQADLVVTVPDSEYSVKNSERNGLWSNGSDAPGAFGQVNILNDNEVLLTFTLVEAGTDTPLEIDPKEKILFSVYDLDRAYTRPQEHEYVRFVTPVASYSVPENTTVEISGAPSDGTLYAQSTRGGNIEDNPTDPLQMSEIAQQSKLSVTYVGQSSWQILFGDKDGNQGGGRNVLFAGRSQGDCACIGISDWTLHENLQYNNLGGLGPVLNDPPELRYSKVFTTGWEQQPIDLVIKVAEGSEYHPFNTERNGLWPAVPGGTFNEDTQMGQINIDSGKVSTFDLIFVKHGTNTPHSLSNVLFSVYDLDENKIKDAHNRFLPNHEYVVFPQAVTNWTLTEDPPTQVKKSGSNDDGTLRFTSTAFGTLADNPTDPLALSPAQKAHSLTVWYSDTSKFQVTFGHEIMGVPKKTKKPMGGRNVIFAGPGIYCPADKEQSEWKGRAPQTYLHSNIHEQTSRNSSSSSSNATFVVFVLVASFGVAVALVGGVIWRNQQNKSNDVVMIPINTSSSTPYNSCPGTPNKVTEIDHSPF